jgi:anti-anti-sigma regulatory factor
MTDEGKLFHLPDRMRGAPVEAGLVAFLKENRMQPVLVCAARVQRLDARLLQVLLAAAADWHARGMAFRVTQVPVPVAQVLGQLGVTPALLAWEGAE